MSHLVTFVSVLLATAAVPSQAQSLTDVVNIAKGYDANYLGARASVDAANYHYEESRATQLPTVSLQMQATRDDSRAPDPDISPTVQETQLSNTAGATFSASQTLFNRQSDIAIDQAKILEESARSQLAQAEQDLIVRVSQAYFNELTAAEAVTAAQGNGKAIAEQLASVKLNFKKGNATITDIREAEARAALARSQQIAADSELFVNTLALDQAIGRTGIVPHALRSPIVLPPILPSQMADWVTMAETDNPALQQARLALEVAQLETARAYAGHLPTLQVNASYGRNRQHDAVSIPGGSFTGNRTSTGLNVTLSVPIFSGFATQNRVNEEAALQMKAQEALEGTQNRILMDVRTAFANVLTQAAQIQALQAAEASSKLALDATLFSYKAGVKLNLDVLNAQSQLYLAQRDVAGVRYQYLLATLKLRQAAGTLTVNDLLPIDGLLSH